MNRGIGNNNIYSSRVHSNYNNNLNNNQQVGSKIKATSQSKIGNTSTTKVNVSYKTKPKTGLLKPSYDFGHNHNVLNNNNLNIYHHNASNSMNKNNMAINMSLKNNNLNEVDQQYYVQNNISNVQVNNNTNNNTNTYNNSINSNDNSSLESTKKTFASHRGQTSLGNSHNYNLLMNNSEKDFNPLIRVPSAQQQLINKLPDNNINTGSLLNKNNSSKSPLIKNVISNDKKFLLQESTQKQITVKTNPYPQEVVNINNNKNNSINNINNNSNSNSKQVIINSSNKLITNNNNIASNVNIHQQQNKTQFKKPSLVTNIKNLNNTNNSNNNYYNNQSVSINPNSNYLPSRFSNYSNSSIHSGSASSLHNKPNYSTGKKGIIAVNYKQVASYSKGNSKVTTRKNSNEKPFTSRVVNNSNIINNVINQQNPHNQHNQHSNQNISSNNYNQFIDNENNINNSSIQSPYSGYSGVTTNRISSSAYSSNSNLLNFNNNNINNEVHDVYSNVSNVSTNLSSYKNKSNLLEKKGSFSLSKKNNPVHKNISNEEINSTNVHYKLKVNNNNNQNHNNKSKDNSNNYDIDNIENQNQVKNQTINNNNSSNNRNISNMNKNNTNNSNSNNNTSNNNTKNQFSSQISQISNNNPNNNSSINNSNNNIVSKTPISYAEKYNKKTVLNNNNTSTNKNKQLKNISTNSALIKIYNKISNHNISSLNSNNNRALSSISSATNLKNNKLANKSGKSIDNTLQVNNYNNGNKKNLLVASSSQLNLEVSNNPLNSSINKFGNTINHYGKGAKSNTNKNYSLLNHNKENMEAASNSHNIFNKNSSCKNIFNNNKSKNCNNNHVNKEDFTNTNDENDKISINKEDYLEDTISKTNNNNNNKNITNVSSQAIPNTNTNSNSNIHISNHSKDNIKLSIQPYNNINNIEFKVYKPISNNITSSIGNNISSNSTTKVKINNSNKNSVITERKEGVSGSMRELRDFKNVKTTPISMLHSPKHSTNLNNANNNSKINNKYLNNMSNVDMIMKNNNVNTNINKEASNNNNYSNNYNLDLKVLRKSISNSNIEVDNRKNNFSVMNKDINAKSNLNNNNSNNAKQATKSKEKTIMDALKTNKMKSTGMNSVLCNNNSKSNKNNINNVNNEVNKDFNPFENKTLKEIMDMIGTEDYGALNSSKLDDSMYSVLEKENSFKRDSDKISKVIKLYYEKKKNYPSTCLGFYKIGRLLGRGAFGKVNLGIHTLSGHFVAIKSFNKSKLNMNSNSSSNYNHKKSKIMYETNVLKNLRHKNIIQFFESFESKDYILIIMEYISCGDLLSYVRRRTRIPETIAKFIFKQIIEGIQYIHSKNIIHRDIKLDNILIDLNNTIKICDFGVSKQIRTGEIISDQCGTPAYIAPEILRNNGYEGYGVDIWSAGVVLYTMLTGTVPFKAHKIEELHKLILKGKYMPISEFNNNLDNNNNTSSNMSNQPISSEAASLLSSILEIDPRKRITSEGILNHPWIKSLDFKQTNKLSLFTEVEKILLSNSKVDLRHIDKNTLHENFTLKNLDTMNEKANENNNTKSYILAPFNSSIHEEDIEEIYNNTNAEQSFLMDDMICNNNLAISNKLIRYVGKVRELNKQYELDHNQEMDGGKIISPMQNTFNDEDEDIKSPNANDYNSNLNNKEENDNPYSSSNYNRHKAKSSVGMPINENDSINNSLNNNVTKVNNGNNMYSVSGKTIINDDILVSLERLGYGKSYVSKLLISNELNYATTCYYLLSNSEEK